MLIYAGGTRAKDYKYMFTNKKKTGVILLIIVSFIVGGVIFNAHQVNAFGKTRIEGFFRGGCDLSELEKDSPEWRAKLDQRKAEIEAKIKEQKTRMEEWETMTPEQRKTKIEEMKASMPEGGRGRVGSFPGIGGQKRRGFGPEGFVDKTDYEVVNLANGVQITITSNDADVVAKLQERAAQFSGLNR